MSELCFIRLASHSEDPVTWWPAATGTVGTGTLEEAAAVVGQREVVVLVPTGQVLLAAARVPGRHRAQRARAVPYSMEDDLARDVEDSHFALPAGAGTTPLPVCVADRERMDGWTAALREAGIRPAALVPDALVLPLAEGSWTVARVNGHSLVRTAANAGFMADEDNLPTLLALALEEHDDRRPARLMVLADDVRADDGPAPALDLAVAAAGLEITVDDSPRPLLARAAAGYDRRTTINLLQGDYAPGAEDREGWRPWLVVATLALLWLAVEGALQVADFSRLKQQEARLDTRIAAAFRDALPGATRMVNPRVQMERRLAFLEGRESGAMGLLPLLHAAGDVLRNESDIKLTALSYRSDALHLDLQLPSLQRLERLKSSLAGTGRAVEIQNASSEGGRVRARIVLREGRP
ncbi:MAG: type II secretion system protein GspL [Gammaproteobacteria bacterium]|nr:type II secretion system protein GspL [Gammaproteobacteria bacterium]